jgi:hypothetical protein
LSHWRVVTKITLHLACFLSKLRDDQRNNVATLTSAARAATAMDIVLVIFGKVIVNNNRHRINVNSACGDVCCNKCLGLTFFERTQRSFALLLTAVTVNRNGSNAKRTKLRHQSIDAVLGATKDDSAAVVREYLRGELLTIASLNIPEHVLNLWCLGRARTDVVLGRTLLVLLDQNVNVTVKRRRKQQRLALLGRHVKKALHLVEETHVGHTVCFVDHNEVNFAKVDVALLDVIKQSTRRRNDDVNALVDDFDLVAKSGTAVDGRDGSVALGSKREQR